MIAVLQVVRNERLGDMNISLTDLMKDAERLLTKKGNVLKPASLTARARVSITQYTRLTRITSAATVETIDIDIDVFYIYGRNIY